jgi:transcriptional regulator with XRE-family HTH domain
VSDTGEAAAAAQRLAANIKAARERKDMSQREVAELMREQKQAWHQQTVAQVEAATRTVGAVELNILADILGTSMDALMRPADLERAASDILSAAAKVRENRRKLADATARFDTDVAWLRRLLDKAREKGLAERLPNEMRTGMAALADRRGRPDVAEEPDQDHAARRPVAGQS